MNKLLNYYIEKNKNREWFERFSSSAGENFGKIYYQTSTNFRKLDSISSIFSNIFPILRKPRSEWPHQESTSQEKHKQYITRYIDSELLKVLDTKKKIYDLTQKGYCLQNMIEQFGLNNNNNWLLNYLFVLNAHFGNVQNSIVIRTKEIIESLKKFNGVIKQITMDAINFINKSNLSFKEIINYDSFWYLSFWKDEDFIIKFFESSRDDRNELIEYCLNILKNKQYDVDCIVYKYKPGSTYSIPTFVDESKILVFTYKILTKNNSSFAEFINSVRESSSEVFRLVEWQKILNFINSNIEIFETIYEDIFGDTPETIDDYSYENQELPSEPIDRTTKFGKVRLRNIKKKIINLAKEKSNYLCELQNFDIVSGTIVEENKCKYFKTESNNKNYVEAHHLIPEKYWNQFEKSIEIVENLIILCPYCHRLIHYGKNDQKIKILNYLYKKRNKILQNKGIFISFSDLEKMYGIK